MMMGGVKRFFLLLLLFHKDCTMLVPEIKHLFFSWKVMGNSQPIQTLVPQKAPLLQLHTKNTHLRQTFILRRVSGIDIHVNSCPGVHFLYNFFFPKTLVTRLMTLICSICCTLYLHIQYMWFIQSAGFSTTYYSDILL